MKNGEGGKFTLYRNLQMWNPRRHFSTIYKTAAPGLFSFLGGMGRGVFGVYNNIKQPYGLLFLCFCKNLFCFLKKKKKKSIYMHLRKSFCRAWLLTINDNLQHLPPALGIGRWKTYNCRSLLSILSVLKIHWTITIHYVDS